MWLNESLQQQLLTASRSVFDVLPETALQFIRRAIAQSSNSSEWTAREVRWRRTTTLAMSNNPLLRSGCARRLLPPRPNYELSQQLATYVDSRLEKEIRQEVEFVPFNISTVCELLQRSLYVVLSGFMREHDYGPQLRQAWIHPDNRTLLLLTVRRAIHMVLDDFQSTVLSRYSQQKIQEFRGQLGGISKGTLLTSSINSLRISFANEFNLASRRVNDGEQLVY